MQRMLVSTWLALLGAAVLAVGACSDDEEADGGGTAGSGNTGNVGNAGGTGNEGGGSGNAGGSGDAGGTGNAGGGAVTPAFCGKSCTGAADCCFGNPTCPGDTYPNNPTCEDGVCKGAQCTADAECTLGGVQPDNKCLTVVIGGEDFKRCATPCEADGECMLLMLKCSGEAKDGTKFCSADPAAGCTEDAECSGGGYGDKCDTATGACTCGSDAECTGTGVDTCVM